MQTEKLEVKQALARLEFDNGVRIANMHCILGSKLCELRHILNDQLIELKYGKGYKLQFMDEILISVDNLR